MKNLLRTTFSFCLKSVIKLFLVVPTRQGLKPTKRQPNSSLPNKAKDFLNVHILCSNELLGTLLLHGNLNARRHLKNI